ncbi:class IV adenylate cyclase [Halomarina pelagica]|uniref:class IV adenylate cyclase n=1 Tax=Halomarina pelagica TaxID=2961599 RepID=UPI0020C4DD10|nr:class IV adenylate cyclase [Halomarina sp. BND7]
MYEVEVKLPADHERVRRRLDELGAAHEATVEQRDTYYDAPHRSFSETDEALRIRRVRRDGETDARVTYKGPLVDDASKTREEVETGVEDVDAMARVLDRLGFDPVATVEKRREVYALDGYTVVLDAVEGLGEFVEVERESAEIDAAREGAFDLCRDLDLDPDDQIRASYLELLLE